MIAMVRQNFARIYRLNRLGLAIFLLVLLGLSLFADRTAGSARIWWLSALQDSGWIKNLREYKIPFLWLLCHGFWAARIGVPLIEAERACRPMLEHRIGRRWGYRFSFWLTAVLFPIFVSAIIGSGLLAASFLLHWDITSCVWPFALSYGFSLSVLSALILLFGRRLSGGQSYLLGMVMLIISSLFSFRYSPLSVSLLGRQHFILSGGLSFIEILAIIGVTLIGLGTVEYLLSQNKEG